MSFQSWLAPGFALVMVCTGAGEFRFGELVLKAPDGFVLARVAGPPLVDRPIVADFDEEGRLYVADSSGSNDPVKKQLEEKPHRIVRLEDRDGDGVFENRTVFADRMMFPEGAMWLDGSLYVSAPPSIWKLTDTNGDGVADRREEWFEGKTLTGCANDLHGPYLGLDGWIYWCKGAFAEQRYARPNGPEFVTRASHIFRRRPEGGFVEPVMTGGMDNPVDVTFTAEGERIFTTTFFQHPGGGQRDGLIHAIYGGVYGKAHDVLDGHKRTGELLPVLTHLGPAAPAGLTRYESDVFGKEYRDNLFAALFNLQKVSRHVLERNGASFRSVDSGFVSSDHHDFHPTDVIEDADGSLLIIDTGGWYKICCPTSQLYKPDVLGAIYRVRRKDGARVADPRGKKIDWKGEMTRWLDDARPAVVRRAVQMLRKGGVVRELREVFERSNSEAKRRNAVWALAGMDSAEAREALRLALKDSSGSVRQAGAHAVSVNRVKEAAPELGDLLRDADLHVRRAAAEALGRVGEKSSVEPLSSALAEMPMDRVLEHSLIYALIEINAPEETSRGLASANAAARRGALIALDQMESGNLRAAQVAELLDADDAVLREAANWIVLHRPEWAEELARIFEKRLQRERMSPSAEKELERQLAVLASRPAMQEVLARALREGEKTRLVLRAMKQARLKETPGSWAEAVSKLVEADEQEVAVEAAETLLAFNMKERPALRLIAKNMRAPAELRLRALAAAAAGKTISTEEFKFALEHLSKGLPSSLAGANALAKAQLSEQQLLALCERVKMIGPMELALVLPAFEKAASEQAGGCLVESLREARGLAGLQSERVRQVFAKYPESVKARAGEIEQLLNQEGTKQAARVEELLPFVRTGDVRRGQGIFNSERAACSACHAIGYLGGDVGPDLTKIGQVRSERDLVEAILFPSASFVRSFEPMTVVTKEGEEYSGILRRDGAEEIVLATGPGTEVRVARAEISEMRPGKVSTMPQGLDEQLSPQELGDLVAFLKATRW